MEPNTLMRIQKIFSFAWIISGGAWGAWVGFAGYTRLTPNADSAASMLSLFFFLAFAAVGFAVGAGLALAIGSLAERILCRIKLPMPLALLIASTVDVALLWQVTAFVRSIWPGLHP